MPPPVQSQPAPLGSGQAETLLDTVLSRAPVGFAMVDCEFRYVRVNEHFAALNGVPVDAHLGRTVREVVPEIATVVEPMLRQVLATGESFRGVEAAGSQLGRPEDARVWEASIFPVRGQDATIIGVGLVVNEITERRRAQEHVRASEELRALIGALSDVVLVLDGEGRYLKVAPTARHLLYKPPEELIGRRLHDVFPPEQADMFLAVIDRALKSGRPVEAEYAIPLNDQTMWFAATVSPLGNDAVVWVAREITNRKRAEDALRRQAVVFETIGDAVLVMDLEGRIVDWNPAASQMFGYSKEEMLGRHVVTIHDPNLEGRLEERIQASLRRDGRWSGELPFRRKDGSEGVADVIVVSQLDDQGRPIAWIGVNRDITARRRAESALAESRALLAEAESLAHVGSWALEPDTGRLTWSDELYRVFGVEPHSVPITTEWFLERVHADDREAVRGAFRRLVEGLDVPWVRCRIQRPDGSERIVQANGRVQSLAGGRPLRVLGSAQDITDLVVAERELREALDTVKALLDAAPVAILAMDADYRVTIWNPAAERIFGWMPAEVLGRPLPIVSAEYQAEHTRFREEVLSGRTVSAIHTRRQRKDGSHVDVYLSIAPLHGAGAQIRGAVALLVDVTEHRQLEEQLQQSQKMEAIGKLAGSVAHDFNNLLTVIRTYSELLLDQIDSTNPFRGDLVEIQRAAGRAASLTRQLLAFSRKQALQPKVLDVNAVAGGLEPMLRRLIGEDVQVIMRPAANVGRVRADPGQLEQVLLNLAVNARDAMPEGGTLTIETSNVELDHDYASRRSLIVPGKYVMLAVSDTGRGMDEPTLARIFEPFFTTKEVGRGTGLGLSTVYGIVKQSSGYIWVYSEPGQGTTFKIYLPSIEDEVSPSDGPHAAQVAAGGAEVVLLVEDDEAVRALGRRILERYGYTVLEARDGADALRVAGKYSQRIDVVVTDMVMPELSGREVYRRLVAARPTLRVLYVSGYTDDDIVRRGLVDASAAFLQKPFTAMHLARAVRAVLDGREVEPEAAP